MFFYKLLYEITQLRMMYIPVKKIQKISKYEQGFRIRVFKRTQELEEGQMKNRGYITVEASLTVPLFLFFMLSVGSIYMLLMAEAHIHQSLSEAAEYTAQYCYLEKQMLKDEMYSADKLINTALLVKQFRSFLGDDYYVKRMIVNGENGILLTVKEDSDNPKIFIVSAAYLANISVPVIGQFPIRLSNQIKQKEFIGYSKEEKCDTYVYVTPNQAVYHTKRSCTHLNLSVDEKSNNEKGHYSPCHFCGKSGDGGVIYVSRTSSVYHLNPDCSGLKRTVSRVKLSEVGGLSKCLRCGN